MSEALAEHPPAPSTAGFAPQTAERDPSAGSSPLTATLAHLLGELASAAAGLDVLYRALEVFRDRYGLEDAVVAVRDETLGLQVFRLGRRPVGPRELEWVRRGQTFFSVPDVVPEEIQALVSGIAAVAVARQLAERDQIRDPLTTLLARPVFNEALRAAAAQSSRYGWTFTVLVVRPPAADGHDAVRRLGHAFARALRSGDTGTRLGGDTFAALLPNATAESLHAFLRRFVEESGVALDKLSYASATAPNETVDPAELFRLAAARLHE